MNRPFATRSGLPGRSTADRGIDRLGMGLYDVARRDVAPPGMTPTGRRLAWCLLVGLGGCAFGASPQSHTDRATLAACRDYASQVYDRNNRGAIYSISQVGLPYSGSFVPENQTNELAARYHNEQIVDDCVRNTGTETNREDTAPPSGEGTAPPSGGPSAPPASSQP